MSVTAGAGKIRARGFPMLLGIVMNIAISRRGNRGVSPLKKPVSDLAPGG
jgi:hypothetical protein